MTILNNLVAKERGVSQKSGTPIFMFVNKRFLKNVVLVMYLLNRERRAFSELAQDVAALTEVHSSSSQLASSFA